MIDRNILKHSSGRSFMAGNNRTVRRAIIKILWDNARPMTKAEILTCIKNDYRIPSLPSTQSLGSLLSKNPQVIKADTEIVLCGDGRRRRTVRYAVNRDLIFEENDIMLTLPHNALYKKDRGNAIQCKTCGRVRIMPPNSEVCLHCVRRNADG